MNGAALPPLWWLARRSVRFLVTLAFAALVLTSTASVGGGQIAPAVAATPATQIALSAAAQPTPSAAAPSHECSRDTGTDPVTTADEGTSPQPDPGAGTVTSVSLGVGPVAPSAGQVVPVAGLDAGGLPPLPGESRAPPLR